MVSTKLLINKNRVFSKKSIATLIDELTVTNIKIYHLKERVRKKQHTREDTKKLQDINIYHSELFKGLNMSTPIKKPIATLIDELAVTNIKIFMLVDKVQKNEHTKKDAKKLQELNSYRTELCNALNREFKQRQIVKI